MEPLPKNCKNCDHQLTGKFCAHCGQAADTHKLNIHFIWHEIQHGLMATINTTFGFIIGLVVEAFT